MSEQEELLDAVNEDDEIIGQETREKVHRNGLLHREVHVWVYNDAKDLLFQKRAPDKDTFPNLWDASVGGHVSAGDSYEETAVRELEEETGVVTTKEGLTFVTKIMYEVTDTVTGLTNNEFLSMYMYQYDGCVEDLRVEEGENDGFEWYAIGDLENITPNEKKQFIEQLFDQEIPLVIDYLKKL